MFQNREEAGFLLAKKLQKFKNSKEAIVLAIPRGGVVVGRQIANILHLPFSLLIVKKLRAPNNPELAVGAITPKGVKVVDRELALRAGADKEYLNKEIKIKRKEVKEREEKFLKRSDLFGGPTSTENKKIIILVDDGVATGATTLAAIEYIKQETRNKKQETRIILAVPVIAKDSLDRLKSEVEEIAALGIPEFFVAVGQYYLEFPQVTDEEVIKLLANN